MISLKDSYPIFNSKHEYIDIHPTSDDIYLRNIFKLFLILFYSLCFGLGIMMYTYHSKFVHSAFCFLGFLVISFIIVIPLHILLHILTLPGNFSDDELCVGFNKKYLDFFVIYNKPISKKNLIISSIFPLLFISIITFLLLVFEFTNMFIYALFCSNILMSTQDIYDTYILLKDKSEEEHTKYIKVENSIYKMNMK